MFNYVYVMWINNNNKKKKIQMLYSVQNSERTTPTDNVHVHIEKEGYKGRKCYIINTI